MMKWQFEGQYAPARLHPDRVHPGWVFGVPALALVALAVVYIGGFNQALFLWLNHLGAGLPPDLWAGMTLFGDSLVAFVLLLPWLRRRPDVVWAMFLAAILAALWSVGVKDWLDTPRPPAVLAAGSFHLIGERYDAFSFPSGHTTAAFTFAGVWALSLARGWLRWLLVAVACLVGLSRIMVGVHWPMDVLGGAVFGWVNAYLGVLWSRHWLWGRRPAARWVLATVLVTAAVVLYSNYDIGYAQVQWLQRALALLCLIWGGVELLLLARDQRQSKA